MHTCRKNSILVWGFSFFSCFCSARCSAEAKQRQVNSRGKTVAFGGGKWEKGRKKERREKEKGGEVNPAGLLTHTAAGWHWELEGSTSNEDRVQLLPIAAEVLMLQVFGGRRRMEEPNLLQEPPGCFMPDWHELALKHPMGFVNKEHLGRGSAWEKGTDAWARTATRLCTSWDHAGPSSWAANPLFLQVLVLQVFPWKTRWSIPRKHPDYLRGSFWEHKGKRELRRDVISWTGIQKAV